MSKNNAPRSGIRTGLLTMTMFVAIGGVAAPRQAHAFATSADIIHLGITEGKNIVAQTKSYLEGMVKSTNSIIDSLLDFSTQQSANNANAMKFQANLADTQNARAVQLATETARYDAQKSATSGASLCNNITGAAATQNLEHLMGVWRSGAVQTMLAADNGHIPGKRGVVTASTIADTYETGHCAHSATDSDNQIGRCGRKPGDAATQPKTTASTGADGYVAAADDQNADLILNATDLTPEQQASMGRLVELLSPDPTGQVVVGSQADSEERRRAFRMADKMRARKSVVHSIVSGLVGQNAVLKSAGDEDSQGKAAAWAEATAAKVAGYVKKCVDGNCKYFPNGVSVNDIMELESRYWFYNLTFGIFASAEGQAPSQKDLNEMQAFKMVMDYRRFRAEREIDMSLAEILSIMIEQQQEKENGNP